MCNKLSVYGGEISTGASVTATRRCPLTGLENDAGRQYTRGRRDATPRSQIRTMSIETASM